MTLCFVEDNSPKVDLASKVFPAMTSRPSCGKLGGGRVGMAPPTRNVVGWAAEICARKEGFFSAFVKKSTRAEALQGFSGINPTCALFRNTTARKDINGN